MHASLFSSAAASNLLPAHGQMYYQQDFLSPQETQHYQALLESELRWVQEPIMLFGKPVMQPRLTALLGDPRVPYGYSGIQMEVQNWPEGLLPLLRRVEQAAGETFTHCLCNWYRDGADSMGWHRDNEKVLGPRPTIASLSFGGQRDFQVRPYRPKGKELPAALIGEKKRVLPLVAGSLLLMQGEMQQFWEHQVPKTKKPVQPRINLTFRHLYTPKP
ncbi:MAG: alpha-ketoglutarate-dependent dioxygenase AlkB family protein [Nitritalea sp.]